MKPHGQVCVTGELHNDMDDGNYVHFAFQMDQSYLRETLNQLKRIVDEIESAYQKAKDNYPADDDDEDTEVN